ISSTLYPLSENAVINDVIIDGDTIYAATNMGLYSADLNNPALPYHVAWSKNELYGDRSASLVSHFNGSVYVAWKSPVYASDTLFRITSSSLEVFKSGESYYDLRESAENLVISANLGVWQCDGNNNCNIAFSYASGSYAQPSTAIY